MCLLVTLYWAVTIQSTALVMREPREFPHTPTPNTARAHHNE